MPDESFVLEKSELSGKVDELMKDGWRLVQICCVKEPSGQEPVQRLEMNYSFDKAYSLINFKVNLGSGEPIDSITPVCPGAYLYENEIHDLFGIAFRVSASTSREHFIKLQYHHRLILRREWSNSMDTGVKTKHTVIPFGPQHRSFRNRCILIL